MLVIKAVGQLLFFSPWLWLYELLYPWFHPQKLVYRYTGVPTMSVYNHIKLIHFKSCHNIDCPSDLKHYSRLQWRTWMWSLMSFKSRICYHYESMACLFLFNARLNTSGSVIHVLFEVILLWHKNDILCVLYMTSQI